MTTLVTGGTGSFGKAYIALHPGEPIRVLSRDEEKQRAMALRLPDVEYVLGDVRDRDALRRAMHGVRTVFHAAALKQVPQCELNPGEAYRTNVVGTENVCLVAQEFGARVVTLSTDKAVEPAGVMGATKFLAEQVTVSYGFGAVRYGNVVGSRGSIVPVVRRLIAEGKPIPVTDPTMTRFLITLDEAIALVDHAMEEGKALIYVRKAPAATVAQIVRVLAFGHPTVGIGSRPGEKKHEHLVAAHEHATLSGEVFTVTPHAPPTGLVYSSDTAPRLTDDDLTALLAQAPDDL